MTKSRPSQVAVTLTPAQYDKALALSRAREISIPEVLRQLLYDAPLPAEKS
jgi:hypothetical protein